MPIAASTSSASGPASVARGRDGPPRPRRPGGSPGPARAWHRGSARRRDERDHRAGGAREPAEQAQHEAGAERPPYAITSPRSAKNSPNVTALSPSAEQRPDARAAGPRPLSASPRPARRSPPTSAGRAGAARAGRSARRGSASRRSRGTARSARAARPGRAAPRRPRSRRVRDPRGRSAAGAVILRQLEPGARPRWTGAIVPGFSIAANRAQACSQPSRVSGHRSTGSDSGAPATQMP